jgi:hypothetical protein
LFSSFLVFLFVFPFLVGFLCHPSLSLCFVEVSSTMDEFSCYCWCCDGKNIGQGITLTSSHYQVLMKWLRI